MKQMLGSLEFLNKRPPSCFAKVLILIISLVSKYCLLCRNRFRSSHFIARKCPQRQVNLRKVISFQYEMIMNKLNILLDTQRGKSFTNFQPLENIGISSVSHNKCNSSKRKLDQCLCYGQRKASRQMHRSNAQTHFPVANIWCSRVLNAVDRITLASSPFETRTSYKTHRCYILHTNPNHLSITSKLHQMGQLIKRFHKMSLKSV